MARRKSKNSALIGQFPEPGRRHAHRVVASAAKSGQKKVSAKSARQPRPAIKTGGGVAVAGSGANAVDLNHQLQAAEARVRELEQRLAGVTDRIAWIADRLHTLLDETR